jgi:alkylated DNA repair dioxygenase AlkB
MRDDTIDLILGGGLVVTNLIATSAISRMIEDLLSEFETSQYPITLFGRKVMQPRLVGWASELPYRYSGLTLTPRPVGPKTAALLSRVNEHLRSVAPYAPAFNHILLNYYRHERDSMGMHADDEGELGRDPWIGSLSLGEERAFVVTRKKKFRGTDPTESVRLTLRSGSLLLMRPPMQHYYLHGLPKSTQSMQPRLNLTFRHIVASLAQGAQGAPDKPIVPSL